MYSQPYDPNGQYVYDPNQGSVYMQPQYEGMQQPTLSNSITQPVSPTPQYFPPQQVNAGSGVVYYQQGPVQYQTSPLYSSYPPPAYPSPVATPTTPTDDPNSKKEKKESPNKNVLTNIGSKVIGAYGSLLKGIGNGMNRLTTSMIEQSKKKQVSDFQGDQSMITRRNPDVPQMRYFDDTFVSILQTKRYILYHLNIGPFTYPAAYLKQQCPTFTLETLDPNHKFLVGNVGQLKVYCLRGTRTPGDVIADLHAVPKPLKFGYVHKGFYTRIDEIISQYPPENQITRVLMTGHSLGGGAAHCGYLLMKSLYPHLSVVSVTFGVPCAVSEEIMRSLEEPREVVNFIDEGDYIPSITIAKYTKQILKWMTVDTSVAEESTFSISDFFAVNNALAACVDTLCHYHPMGVYYYLPLQLKKYVKRPLRCRTEEHLDALFSSQMDRKICKFLYHMIKSYKERLDYYVFNSSLPWDNFDNSIRWLNPIEYEKIMKQEEE